MLLWGFGIQQRKKNLKYFRKMIFTLEKKRLNRKVGFAGEKGKLLDFVSTSH